MKVFSEKEIERDPIAYLKKDQRAAAPLLEGAAARSGAYSAIEADINGYIAHFLAEAEATLRKFRRSDIGDEAAEQERTRHAKLDSDVADTLDRRIRERDKARFERYRIKEQKELEDKKADLERQKAELDKKAMEALLQEGQNTMKARSSHKSHFYPPEQLPGPARRDGYTKPARPSPTSQPHLPHLYDRPDSARSPLGRGTLADVARPSSRRSSVYPSDIPVTASSPHTHTERAMPSSRRESGNRDLSPDREYSRRGSAHDRGIGHGRSPARERPEDDKQYGHSRRREDDRFDDYDSRRHGRRHGDDHGDEDTSRRYRDHSRSSNRRHRRDGYDSGSRSPNCRSGHYDRPEKPSGRSSLKRPRSTSPPGIDRFISGTSDKKRRSIREGEHDRERSRERSRGADHYRERHRDGHRDQDRDLDRDRDSEKRDRYREKQRRHDRSRSYSRGHSHRHGRSRSRDRKRDRHHDDRI